MKNKYWIVILAVILLGCLGLSLLLFSGNQASDMAQIQVDGKVYKVVNLHQDQQFVIDCPGGTNSVTIEGGKIAVTAADCPDQYCVQRGFVSGGTPIVCLPHRLVIEFLGAQEIDGILG